MTITQYRDNRDRVLYANWKVQEFRSVERFSDYQKIKARLRQGDAVPGVLQGKRRIWLPDHRLTIVIAVTGVISVLLTVVLVLRS
jgi:hypothetical protein